MEPEPEPEPEPEQQLVAAAAAAAYTPVPLVWRETDEISSAESTPMSAMSPAWSGGGSSGEPPSGGSGSDRAHTPVPLVWRETDEISSAESTPMSAMSAMSALTVVSPTAPVQLVWRDTDEISSGESSDDDEKEDEEEDDDEEDDSDDDDDDSDDGSDDSWSVRPEAPADEPGDVEARLQAEIDARVAHELAVRDRSLAVACGVRDLATEVQGLVGESEQSELLQRVAPPSVASEPSPGEAAWAETAEAMSQLCDGLSARVAAAVAYDPVAVARVQKRLVDAGCCALLPGLEEHELTTLQQKFGARFPPELRAFLRCGVPVDPAQGQSGEGDDEEERAEERQSDEGWVNWHLLLDRGIKCGSERDVVTARRSEWAALLNPESSRAQGGGGGGGPDKCPLLPIFGRAVIPTAPSRSGLPVWTTTSAADFAAPPPPAPAGGGRSGGEGSDGDSSVPAPPLSSSAATVCVSVASTFWHWLESEHGVEGLIARSIPPEWTAEAVPADQVAFWPEAAAASTAVSGSLS